jgi:cobalt-zinc-cadmium efflux system outer membrane protein
MVKHSAITAIIVVALAAWAAPSLAQELSLGVPALQSPLALESPQQRPREIARVPEPIPLPPVQNPDTADRLTLAEAELMAVAFHPALREIEGRLNAARGKWVQVGLRPNPMIGYDGQDMGDSGTAGKQGGFISKELVTAGKLRLNRAVASREQAVVEERMQQTRLQVITTVRLAYYEALAAERQVTLARQLTEIAGEAVRVSDQRLKALDIPRSSLLQSQIESESAMLLEQQAEQRREAALRELAASIGMHDRQPMLLEDVLVRPLPEMNWETTRSRLMSESPELAALHFAVERAKCAVERAAAGRVPNLNLETGVQYDNTAKDTIANVRLSMPLQIFDRNQGAIAEAYGELAAAQAALDKKEIELHRRLAAAIRDYNTARQRVTTYAEKVLPVARETLDITSTGYREGEIEFIQVLAVQQTYAQKNLSYLQDLEAAWKNWAEIDGLLVGPVSASATAADLMGGRE